MLQERERQYEEKHLQQLLEQLRRKYQMLETEVAQQKEEVKTFRTNFWSDISVNTDNWDDLLESFADISQKSSQVAEHERKYRHAHHSLTRIKRMLDSPYFGRVDFVENGSPQVEQIYIGTSSLRDEESQDFLVYDWRAPISSIFYDYPPGPAAYETPMGEISGEIKLKRQYVIRNGKILSMFDAGVTIGDEILQQVLGKNADAQMRSIVSTIQKEQNQIIREADRKIVIVQGAAGSGKTSVALQRIAFLLYKYRNRLTSDNMVLFSPNPLFKNYIANVLPELGEENIQQSTLFEYVESQLGNQYKVEDPYTQLEELFLLNQGQQETIRTSGIRYKGSLAFFDSIEAYASRLNREGMHFQPLTFRGRVLISEQEMEEVFYGFDALRLSIRVDFLKEWLIKRLKTMEKEEREQDWVRNEIEGLEKDLYQEAFRLLQKKNRFHSESFTDYQDEELLLRKMVVREHFQSLYRWVKELRFIDLLANYKELFHHPDRYLKFGKKEELPAHVDEICNDTIERLNQGYIPYEDAMPLLLLKGLTEGFRRYMTIQYVVVDEAQDYTPFQLRFIARIFPRSKWTILGDLNQAIWPHHALLSENPFLESAAEEEIAAYRLTKSYRSTKEIVEFTKKILLDDMGIEAFERHGEPPRITKAANENQLNQEIIRRINELQADGMQTVAIICKTEKESEKVYHLLKQHLHLQLIRKDIPTYEEGVVVIPSYLAKGLEFDAVIVYNASSRLYGRESERNLLYTVCTRALHRLEIYYLDSASPFLPIADEM